MKSRATPKFWKYYSSLPLDVQRRAEKAYHLWKKNPHHPGLHFKRVDEREPVYSVRISNDYRALGMREEEAFIWFWIGSHDEYERLLNS